MLLAKIKSFERRLEERRETFFALPPSVTPQKYLIIFIIILLYIPGMN